MHPPSCCDEPQMCATEHRIPGRVYLLPSQPGRTCTPYVDLGQETDLHRGGAVRSCGTQRPGAPRDPAEPSARLTPRPQHSCVGVPCLRRPLPAAGMPARPHPPRASQTQPQRAHLRQHAPLHVEDRRSAEPFRLDCSVPTPEGHQDCRQGPSLRATTGGGSQPQHTRIELSGAPERVAFPPPSTRAAHARGADEIRAAVATSLLKVGHPCPHAYVGALPGPSARQ